MPWFVICHDPEHPHDTSFVTEDEGIGSVEVTSVFPDEKAAEDWIKEREKQIPIYDYRSIEF